LVILVLAAALAAGASQSTDLERRTAAAAAEANETSLQGLVILQALTDAETAQRGYLLTGRSAYLQSYEQARGRARAAVDKLGSMSSGASGLAAADRLKALTDRRLDILDNTIQLTRAGRRAEALASLDSGQAVMDELRRELAAVVTTASARENAVRAQRRDLYQQSRLVQIGLGVLAAFALLMAVGSLLFERIAARRAAKVQAQLNAELRAAHSLAHEANEAKSRFLATASHDMRQPLHALALYISTLERRVESPQARDILRNMDGAVRSMTRLFAALLDLARLEAGALKPEPIDFALGPLLQEVVSQSMGPGEREAARLRLVETDLEVHSDPDLLEVILRNLTSNAVKHSKGEVLLGCRRVGEAVRIEVHDNGQGIPEDQIQRLFSEFVRGQDAGSAEGIGLGLAIVERMAKLLDHPLAVQSRPGQGSVFAVTVPRAGPRALEAPAAGLNEDIALDGAHILVADDEPLALDAMKHAFEDAGAKVTTARSAAEARAHGGEAFDLYVFDLNLGRDDGLSLLSELEQTRGEPIAAFIVTGATTPDVLAQLRGAGRRWVTKPITAATLTSVASSVLSARA
ncbi:MAG TPA: ATP-binding protein, partial [Caulobacteraceae bacterium]|nr:ATP-binding protein [Caulobacteraceae bacterium]